eukprot:CAMPEP_0168727528 /NCGR_PEP_ID=MMETSP0724-20121128/5223_1 /TAXON_ID=265536 /ORGANISM="Amphiprora sp., Strain CCMP467" /LENGTH=554 /DNA_ID=CAMNT_0008774361 /DNA_START=6 /DNA_END=1667 /DNA_ORIENTATION=+
MDNRSSSKKRVARYSDAGGAAESPATTSLRKKASTKNKKLKVAPLNDFQKRMLAQREAAFLRLNKEFQSKIIDMELLQDAGKVGFDPRHPEFAKLENLHGAYQMTARDIRRQYGGDTAGDVCVFGLNDVFQLGFDNEGISTFLPTNLQALQHQKIRMIDCGGMHNVALSETGNPWTWGVNDDDALGRLTPNDDDATQPNVVTGFMPKSGTAAEDGQITQVSCGDIHTLFLSEKGNVYSCGTYKEKDSKKFKIIADEGQSPIGSNSTPQHIWEMPGEVISIASGGDWAAAILKDRTIVTWGMGQSGEMGRSKDMKGITKKEGKFDLSPEWYKGEDGKIDEHIVRTNFMKPQPPRFNWGSPKKTAVTIGCGLYHMVVVAREPGAAATNVYSTGLNKQGQLGHGDQVDRHELTLIKKLEGKNIAQVGGGEHFSLALDMTGQQLFAWGAEDKGQLGKGRLSSKFGGFVLSPILVRFPTEEPVLIKKIVAGDRAAYAISAEDELWSWGFAGVAGHKGREDRDTLQPKRVDLPRYLKRRNAKAYDVGGGGQHGVAIYQAW